VSGLDSIILEGFSKQRSDLYRIYRRLKYDVFVVECGWDSLGDESGDTIAKEDPYDECGRFWLARTCDGLPIGVIRGNRLQDGFPHRQLLHHHLQHFQHEAAVDTTCTLNALAVLPDYRGQPCEVPARGWRGTVAKLLLLAIVRSLEAEGQRAAIATCAGLRSARLCLDSGFAVLDRPTKTSLHPALMTNIGMVFESPAHVEAQKACGIEPLADRSPQGETRSMQAYFAERHRIALDSKPLESYFSDYIST
jgi:hypothetical protein